MSTKDVLNIKVLFIITASEVKGCSKVVNEIYKTDEEKYFNLYLNSGLRNDLMINSLSYEGQKNAIKLIGILESVYATKNLYIIEKIISGYNRKIARYFKKGGKDIDYCCKDLVSIEKSEFDILVPIIFSVYYAVINDIDYEISSIYFESLTNTWLEYSEFIQCAYLVDSVEEVTPSEIVDEKLTLKEIEYKIDSFKECYLSKSIKQIKSEGRVTINNLIDNILYEYELEVIKKEHLKFEDTSDYFDFRRRLFNESTLFKRTGSISLVLKYHGLNCFSLTNTKSVNLKQLKILIIATILRLEANQYDIKDLPVMFIDTLYFNSLSLDYITVKNNLLNKSEVQRFEELNKLESQLNKKQESLEKNITKYTQTISMKNSELIDVRGKLKESSSKIINLNKELNNSKAKEESLLNEIEELKAKLNREITANKNLSELDTVEEVSMEEKIQYLNEKNISIIGGANNIKNILSTLPNVFLFNEKNKDATALLKYDFIFINSDFISHSLVFKINSLNISYNYISGTNFDLIIDSMYKLIKKSEL